MGGLRVRVLGPPQVVPPGDSSTPTTGRTTALVVRLALADGAPVPGPVLRADLWPDDGASDTAVRVALTRARQQLGTEAIERRGNGYVLTGAELDAARFEQRLAAARDRGRPLDDRIATYTDALAMWSGRALEGFDGLGWASSHARRLDDLRELAVDEHIELALLTGAHERVLPDLRRAFEDDPLREQRAVLLATALYRSGRQAEALDVIDRTRRELRDQLGLGLSGATAELEHRILRHDPALAHVPVERVRVLAVDVEARVRAVTALLRAGVVDEAAVIVDAAEREARDAGDRRSLGNVLLARARLAAATGHDPHPHIDEARGIGRQIRSGELLAAAAITRFQAGVPSDKYDVMVEMTEPLELLPPTARERIDLLCAAAVIVAFIDASASADRLVMEAERTHERIGSPKSLAVLLVARSLVAAVRRDPDATLADDARRAYEVATASEDPRLVVIAIQALLRHHYTHGEIDAVDGLLPALEDAAGASFLSFGLVRAHLCRGMNALARGELDEVPGHVAAAADLGARLRTFAWAGAVRVQQLWLALERDERAVIGVVAAQQRAVGRHPVWTATCAVAGDDAAARDLVAECAGVQRDDSYWALLAIAAIAAAERRDAELGGWCAERLEVLGDCTVVVGLGSIVLGFAHHYLGLARVATGDLDLAARHFEQASELAERQGADLWQAHSDVELASVLASAGGDPARARELLHRWSSDADRLGWVWLGRRIREVRSELTG
ncbi:MAG: AfsR/SARP family transcriptional regulator [Ilumatobacteraceae bacterium]|nr:AfsR/SARP family transcriptional regulator [Ilumatobacteraceae bacterium]